MVSFESSQSEKTHGELLARSKCFRKFNGSARAAQHGSHGGRVEVGMPAAMMWKMEAKSQPLEVGDDD